jgi:transcriptional regulator with XRE-family HTH domain
MYARANNQASSIGAAIRIRRRALRLTQRDVAELCGVQRQTIGRLESGDTAVSLGTALTVAKNLGLDIVAVPLTPGDAQR